MAKGSFSEPAEPLHAELPFVVRYLGKVSGGRAEITRSEPPRLRYEVPIRRRDFGFEVELNLSHPGAYQLSYGTDSIALDIRPREQLGLLSELGLTTILVILGMGVALLWTRRRKRESSEGGSFFLSGSY